METRELLGETPENSVSLMRGHWFAGGQTKDFVPITKESLKKNKLNWAQAELRNWREKVEMVLQMRLLLNYHFSLFKWPDHGIPLAEQENLHSRILEFIRILNRHF